MASGNGLPDVMYPARVYGVVFVDADERRENLFLKEIDSITIVCPICRLDERVLTPQVRAGSVLASSIFDQAFA